MIAQELEVSLHMAFVEARQKRHEFITVEHLLLALLDNPTAAEVLRACGANMDELRKNLSQQGIARLDVVNYISHGITKTPQAHPGKSEQDADQEGQAETSNSPLDNYTQNLNALALAGKIDPLIGRDKELERVVQTLCRR